jgi:hypothetical protein
MIKHIPIVFCDRCNAEGDVEGGFLCGSTWLGTVKDQYSKANHCVKCQNIVDGVKLLKREGVSNGN